MPWLRGKNWLIFKLAFKEVFLYRHAASNIPFFNEVCLYEIGLLHLCNMFHIFLLLYRKGNCILNTDKVGRGGGTKFLKWTLYLTSLAKSLILRRISLTATLCSADSGKQNWIKKYIVFHFPPLSCKVKGCIGILTLKLNLQLCLHLLIAFNSCCKIILSFSHPFHSFPPYFLSSSCFFCLSPSLCYHSWGWEAWGC